MSITYVYMLIYISRYGASLSLNSSLRSDFPNFLFGLVTITTCFATIDIFGLSHINRYFHPFVFYLHFLSQSCTYIYSDNPRFNNLLLYENQSLVLYFVLHSCFTFIIFIHSFVFIHLFFCLKHAEQLYDKAFPSLRPPVCLLVRRTFVFEWMLCLIIYEIIYMN